MSTTVSVADSARQELGASFRGQLIGPEDAEYDEARKVYNAMIDRRPALIARCAGADDVAGTIAFARSHDLLLAVRGGGHNGGGLGVVDDGVVVRPVAPARGRRRSGGAHGSRRRRLYLGQTSTTRHSRTISRCRAGSSRRPGWAASPSAAGSGT